MANYFLAAINGSPSSLTADDIAWEIAVIKGESKTLDRVEALGSMNYSRINPYEENHKDLIEIIRLCIQLQNFGKLEEIKKYLQAMKQEVISKYPEEERSFIESTQRFKEARLAAFGMRTKYEEMIEKINKAKEQS